MNARYFIGLKPENFSVCLGLFFFENADFLQLSRKLTLHRNSQYFLFVSKLLRLKWESHFKNS